jgi:molecular chaperone Hsp33
MKDYVIRARNENNSIRAFAAITTNMVEEVRQIHDMSPIVSAAMGRTMTAAVMLGRMVKGEKDLLTVQIKGEGPLKGLVVTADSHGNVKGYPYNSWVDIPLNAVGKLDVSGAIGKGAMSIIKDLGLKDPYVGQIDLVSGEIAEDFTYYFATSEQTPSAVALGVLVDSDYSIKQSGGFIIQLLPEADEETIQSLEESLGKIHSITHSLDQGMTPEDILKQLLGDIVITEKTPVQFQCNCSKERVEKALISIGISDLKEILEQDKKAELKCHFCNKTYVFDEKDLNSIIDEVISNSSNE